MCLAEGSLMVYPKIRPGVLFLGHLVGAPGEGAYFFRGSYFFLGGLIFFGGFRGKPSHGRDQVSPSAKGSPIRQWGVDGRRL